ncbi:hypothetical protein MMG00_01640 [Ignatzschineria rhizosphaerae]|uniref:Uncharacterized protein n=1 Tax=Ignatzschineria rhizosphaerae TaxID=2923279 RepID=A0ABY3X4A6_9GAMM|nr:hypothetical protein [Ignatzschineria rhizosphaerae]UNM96591.1 hypothetical protein MMG00_01640 [Ignatzschineria rhizosphaerae]
MWKFKKKFINIVISMNTGIEMGISIDANSKIALNVTKSDYQRVGCGK